MQPGTVQPLLMVAMMVFLVMAAVQRNVMKSCISLAVGSVFLSVIFLNFRAAYAAAFELSVCAGLITVLLMTTIVLVRPGEGGELHE